MGAAVAGGARVVAAAESVGLEDQSTGKVVAAAEDARLRVGQEGGKRGAPADWPRLLLMRPRRVTVYAMPRLMMGRRKLERWWATSSREAEEADEEEQGDREEEDAGE